MADFLGRVRQGKGIGELHEIDIFRADYRGKLGQGGAGVMGDADITHPALGFQPPQGFEMGAPIDHVVNLEQIHHTGAHQAERLLDLAYSGGFAIGIDLGRQEGPDIRFDPIKKIAGYLFRPAIHGRGIDYAATGGEQITQHLCARLPFRTAPADIEPLPGADPDGGNFLTGFGYDPHQHETFSRFDINLAIIA